MIKYTIIWCITPIEFNKNKKVNDDCLLEGFHIYLKDQKYIYLWYTPTKLCLGEEIKVFSEDDIPELTELFQEQFDIVQNAVSDTIITPEDIKLLFSVNYYGGCGCFGEFATFRSRCKQLESMGFKDIPNYTIHKYFDKIINGDYNDIYDEEREDSLFEEPEPSTGKYTWWELCDKCERDKSDIILYFLPYYYAEDFCTYTYTHWDWETNKRIPYTSEGLKSKLKERLSFLEEKLEDERMLSVSKACFQISVLLDLMGQPIDLDDFYPSSLIEHVRTILAN